MKQNENAHMSILLLISIFVIDITPIRVGLAFMSL